MALSVGEIEAVLRARDEMTPVLKQVTEELRNVPAAAQGASDATGKVGDTASGAVADLTSFAGGLATTILSFEGAKKAADIFFEALAYGNKLDNLSQQTGIAVGTLQELGLAAQQSGTTIERMALASEQLGRKLVEGGVSDALHRMGVSAQELLSMNPGDRLIAVSEALDKIPDPTVRAATAMELFGAKSGAAIEETLEKLHELHGFLPTLSDEQVKNLSVMDDTWELFEFTVKTSVAKVIADISDPIGSLKDSDLFNAIFDLWTNSLDKAADAAAKAAPKIGGLVPPAQSVAEATRILDERLGVHNEKLITATREADAYNKKIQEQADIITGKALAKEVNLYADAIDRAGGVTKITDYQTDQLTTKFMHLGVEGANLKPELEAVIQKHIDMHGRMQPVIVDVQTLIGMFKNYELAINNIPPAIGSMVDNSQEKLGELLRIGGVDVDALKAKWEEYREEVGEKVPEAHAKMVVTISGVLQQLFEGMLHGWDGFKAALKNIFDEIVKYYEEKFIAVLAEKLADFLVGLGVGGAGGGFLGDLLGFLGSLVGGGNGNAPLPGEPLPGPPPSQNPGDPQPLPPGMAPPGVGVNPGSPVPKPLARGGYVDQPTLALVGEGGPEFVIPAEKMGDMFGGDTHVHVYIDGREAAEAIAPHLPRVAKRYGLTRPA